MLSSITHYLFNNLNSLLNKVKDIINISVAGLETMNDEITFNTIINVTDVENKKNDEIEIV
jgi:hypothetical protein